MRNVKLPDVVAERRGMPADDPFGDAPYVLKTTRDGSFLVYSVGPDGKDDGGAPRLVQWSEFALDPAATLNLVQARLDRGWKPDEQRTIAGFLLSGTLANARTDALEGLQRGVVVVARVEGVDHVRVVREQLQVELVRPPVPVAATLDRRLDAHRAALVGGLGVGFGDRWVFGGVGGVFLSHDKPFRRE